MKQEDFETKQTPPLKKQKKRRVILFVFCLITLFLVSFSTTSLILMKSYRLTFVKENYAELQQQVKLLKNELSRKDNEIEELKLQLANIEGESSFVNQMQKSKAGDID